MDDAQKKILQSQGIKLSNSDETLRARNKIDEVPKKFWLGKFWKYRKLVTLLLAVLAVLILLGYGGITIYKHFSGKDGGKEELIREIGALVELPQGEEPSILTVTDPQALKGQLFFKESRVGDKVLIFGRSKKALLYRPSEKKVIHIAPIK